jgi:hypothetical protein
VWDRLRAQVTLERQQLRHLLDVHRRLLDKCSGNPPDEVELSALASMLHSFYNGVENIFKRVATELDGGVPSSKFWHRQLLDSMKLPGRSRPAVLSDELADRLDEYLQFRHLFRHAYTFDLRWESMKALTLGCQQTLARLETELDRFLEGAANVKEDKPDRTDV